MRVFLATLLALALISSAAAQTDKAQVSEKKAPDFARKDARADLLTEKLRQMQLNPNLGLEQGDLAGSGLLLGFGKEFLEQFKNQMDGFPDGEFTGTLAGFDGTGGIAAPPGGRFQPAETAIIRKDTSLTGKRSAGDSRLMSGDASTTYTITSSHTDEQSSDGSQKVTETLTVTDDEGNSFSQTITHETNSEGEVTESQTVTSTDSNGNTTNESSCTGKNCGDTESGGEDSSGEAAAAEGDDPPPSQEGRPDPEGGADCTGPGCEEFELFTSGLLASLEKNRIEPQQGADTMMQPGEGTKPASGKLTNAAIEKAGKERLNPLILHDNASGESAPLPGPDTDQPIRNDPDWLVNPPDEGGELPDESEPPRKR
jgi:hypothetical protein